MTLDFMEPGHVVIWMSDYVSTMLNDVPDEMDGNLLTPTASHLFKVNNVDPKPLPQDKKDIFIHLVMQGLYLSQQGHPDIRTTILFLCGRLMMCCSKCYGPRSSWRIKGLSLRILLYIKIT